MMTEFLGSFLVFGFALLFANSKYRWLLYGVACLITFNTWFLAFVIGMLFADLYSNGLITQKKRGMGMFGVLLGGILLGGYPLANPKGTVYQFITFPYFAPLNHQALYTILGACLVVYTVISTKQIARVLGHKRISILGRYTFSLYLVHMSILFTFTTGIFLYLNTFMGYNKSVLLSLLLSIPFLWMAAWAFEKYIDNPSIRFARYCANIYQGKQTVDVRPYLVGYMDKIKTVRNNMRGRLTSVARTDKEPLE
jgi:peptidoglycan/LPS O-acetylase OafA/YrhL